jgi:hypothetical protein
MILRINQKSYINVIEDVGRAETMAVEFRNNIAYHALGFIDLWTFQANHRAIVIEESHVVLQYSYK